MIIHDGEICVVRGLVTNGADCATTISQKERYLNFSDFINHLQANDKKGAAVIQSVDDYMNTKTSLEQACKLLKNKCVLRLKSGVRQQD